MSMMFMDIVINQIQWHLNPNNSNSMDHKKLDWLKLEMNLNHTKNHIQQKTILLGPSLLIQETESTFKNSHPVPLVSQSLNISMIKLLEVFYIFHPLLLKLGIYVLTILITFHKLMDQHGFMITFQKSKTLKCSSTQEILMEQSPLMEVCNGFLWWIIKSLTHGESTWLTDKSVDMLSSMLVTWHLDQFMVLDIWLHNLKDLKLITWSSTGSKTKLSEKSKSP